MLKIVYRVLTKEGQAQVFKKLAEDVLVPEALQMPNCQQFSLFQNTANPREFIFYEQWKTLADVAVYKQKLLSILGEARSGEEFPARMNELIEADEDLI